MSKPFISCFREIVQSLFSHKWPHALAAMFLSGSNLFLTISVEDHILTNSAFSIVTVGFRGKTFKVSYKGILGKLIKHPPGCRVFRQMKFALAIFEGHLVNISARIVFNTDHWF